MERKIIKQGKGGLTIYLPKKWADKKGLKEGDNIQIDETETALIISSEVRGKKSKAIKITDVNKGDVVPILTHLYRRGLDSVTLSGIDKTVFDAVKTLTRDILLGFEVTAHDGKSCTISNISEPTENKYEVLVNRLIYIISETGKVFSEDYEKGDFSRWQEVTDLKTQHDKFTLFCKRVLHREKYEDPVIEWELLTFLMHMEHNLYYSYKYAKDNKAKKNEKIVELLKEMHDYFALFSKAYFQKDLDAIHAINSKKGNLQFGKCYKYLEQSSGVNTVLLSHIREQFRLIQIGTSPILAGLLEKEM